MQRGKAEVKPTSFKAVILPTGTYALIPGQLTVFIPDILSIPARDRHTLAYIPWHDAYMRHIPGRYRKFFAFVLPSLHARTSDVHTALSAAQLPYLLPDNLSPADRRVIYLAIILHDCGWSQVSLRGLVQSLSYGGLSPTSPASAKPKQQHLVYGAALAFKLLDSYDFSRDTIPEPTDAEKYHIAEIIRRHDHDAAWEKGKYGAIHHNVSIVCDSDRLWSYTFENFWLDTIRKGVQPEEYVATIAAEIPNYFFTDKGKARALELIHERRREVEDYIRVIEDSGALAAVMGAATHPSVRLLEKARKFSLEVRSRRLQRLPYRRKAA